MKKIIKKNKVQKKEKKPKFIEGTVVRNPRGFGWLSVVDGPKDSFIPPHELDNILDGDKVKCTVSSSPKGPVAHIVSVITRSEKPIIGTLAQEGKKFHVLFNEGILGGKAFLDKNSLKLAAELPVHSSLEVKVLSFPKKSKAAQVSIIKSLGQEGDFSTEIQKIISDSKVLTAFPDAVIKEAQKFGTVPSKKDQQGRIDLKKIALVTIDGKTAKDFDDAVFASKEGEDYKVIVAIADVSHYVAEGSELDKQAFRRATSIYYPGHCIPMLPENISNGLCSLMPKVDRLCMAVEFYVTPKGAVKKVKAFNAVMRSHARLTYDEVQEHLEGKKELTVSNGVKTSLTHLREAALRLRLARQKRGAIDFDIVESVISLNDSGEPINIHPDERLESHRLIEDLMVATNEAVATFIESKSWPNIVRVHGEPTEEKLASFYSFAEAVGLITAKHHVAWKKKSKAQLLSAIAQLTAEHPAQAALNTMLLRTMQQAQYSSHNIGHFGLASKAYAHFTSPIRRYPDLVVHRLLKEILSKKGKHKLNEAQAKHLEDKLSAIAEHCSTQERVAVDLERTISAFHAAWFMRKRIGVTDAAVVTGVTEFGAFVRLQRYHVEGLVHVANMKKNGFLDFDHRRLQLREKRSGFGVTLGDKLNVRLIGVDLAKRRIDFELA